MLFASPCIAAESAPVTVPLLPAQYYGTATIDEEPIAVGTVLIAVIESDVVGEITVTESGKIGNSGTFGDKLLISGSSSDAGKAVHFRIANVLARESVIFVPGDCQELSLTFISDNIVENTVADGSWSAEVAARISYSVSPENLTFLTAPDITSKSGSTLRLTNVSAELTYDNETTESLPISVNPDDGNLIYDTLPANVLSIRVTFEGRVLGDVTGRGSPGMSDANSIAQYYAGNSQLDEDQLFYGDVTGRGSPGMSDANSIAQYYAGNVNKFYQ